MVSKLSLKYAKDFLSLSAVQFASSFTPFLIIPLLNKSIGMDGYGLIIYNLAIIELIMPIVLFGLNIGSIHFYNMNDYSLKSVYNKSVEIRGFIAIFLLVILLALKAYGLIHFNIILVSLSTHILLYEIFIPSWVFQIKSKMTKYAFIGIIHKFLILGIILLQYMFSEINVYSYPATQFCVTLGIILFTRNSFYSEIEEPNRLWLENGYIKLLKAGYPLVLSGVSVKLINVLNKVILGSVSPSITGSYDILDKLIILFKKPANLLTQVLFFKSSTGWDQKSFLKYLYISLLFGGISSIILLNANHLLDIFGVNNSYGLYTRIMASVIVVLVYFTQAYGVHKLLAKGYTKEWSRILIYSALFYLLIVSLVSYLNAFSINSLILATLGAEAVLFIFSYIRVKALKL